MGSLFGRGPLTLVVAAIALFAVGGAAFTAANTTPGSSAGDDTASVITGFTISGITYTLDTTTPTNIDTVAFTAQADHGGPWPAALGTKLGRFTTTATHWFVCTDNAGGAAAGTYVVTCLTDTTGNGGNYYNGITASVQLTTATAVEFDTVLVQ
ncbi:MAG: hypothetical protein O3A10_11080 [Chloroflexi bacterium]|nr:hypothetical protein [Chloroflexota bacterium]MDA1146252.1 hypothetical protein [Chloroflexota bacterium]